MIEFKTIGADPEFALRKGNKNVPSFHYFEGTKQNPEDKGNGFAILKDNLLVEGNIPPADNFEDFRKNSILLQNLIKEAIYHDGTSIIYKDIVKYNKNYILTQDGLEFGCSSYNDAWTGEVKQSPDLSESFYRPVGNHIHVGYELKRKDIDPMQVNEWLAKAFDFFLSLPGDTIHFTKKRRDTYGAYGSYRDTPYGLEFRALGGYFANTNYLEWIYTQVLKTIDFCSNIENCKKLHKLKEPSYKHYDFLGINLLDQIPIGDNFREFHRYLYNINNNNQDGILNAYLNFAEGQDNIINVEL